MAALRSAADGAVGVLDAIPRSGGHVTWIVAAQGYVVAETRGPHGGGIAAWSVGESIEAAEEME